MSPEEAEDLGWNDSFDAEKEYQDAFSSLVEENKRMRKVLSYLYGHLDLLIGSVRHAAKTDHRWEGMDEIVVKWRSEISEALGDINA